MSRFLSHPRPALGLALGLSVTALACGGAEPELELRTDARGLPFASATAQDGPTPEAKITRLEIEKTDGFVVDRLVRVEIDHLHAKAIAISEHADPASAAVTLVPQPSGDDAPATMELEIELEAGTGERTLYAWPIGRDGELGPARRVTTWLTGPRLPIRVSAVKLLARAASLGYTDAIEGDSACAMRAISTPDDELIRLDNESSAPCRFTLLIGDKLRRGWEIVDVDGAGSGVIEVRPLAGAGGAFEITLLPNAKFSPGRHVLRDVTLLGPASEDWKDALLGR